MKQDFQKKYTMTTPTQRFIITQQCNDETIVSETIPGKKQKWWLHKHNPDNEIPKNIYLLGEGTIEELYNMYKTKYGIIVWDEFRNYTRELIKQNIML